MKRDVIIVEHAFKHGLSASDISHAWDNFIRMQHRGAPHEGEIILVGYDKSGHLIELVAAERPFGIVIFHAMRPPTRNMLIELGMTRR